MENKNRVKQILRQKFLPYLVLKSHIFELPNLELNKYIDNLIESNPFIDEGDTIVYEEFETVLAPQDDDLYSFLRTQIEVCPVDDTLKEIAYKIVDNLDECGFLTKNENDLVKEIGVKKSDFRKALEFVQTLEPIGVAARNIQEYFVIQLSNEDEVPAEIKKLIFNDLENLMKENYKELIKKYKMSKEELFSLREKLLSMDACPAKEFRTVNFISHVPDIIVEKDGDDFKVSVNRSSRRVIRLVENYAKLIDRLQDKIEKVELEDLLNRAQWSIHAIEERDNLLEKIAQRIVSENVDFLKGTGEVNKLSIEDFVSEDVDYSTISRLIQGKYILTPISMFPLRYFIKHKNEKFNEEKVLKEIREIIENEDKTNPYTDEEIEKILKDKGYDIKRRTVSKYREKLKIPNSSKRKVS
ncbi:RNA polymerase factor sigma-54 [Caldisericum exile]|uniref:RNA polymerase sigma-54 factor n=2 Tax=Caldisericum exile TaxID=693075 RepID=A0A7U6GE82_CALEA|nr:RNA polymerase factor sigma-54 [Caldisericum exile]BAL80773.1 putative RNA polymerase sigma-54 factor [Caldisericum exile AZM16c01]